MMGLMIPTTSKFTIELETCDKGLMVSFSGDMPFSLFEELNIIQQRAVRYAFDQYYERCVEREDYTYVTQCNVISEILNGVS